VSCVDLREQESEQRRRNCSVVPVVHTSTHHGGGGGGGEGVAEGLLSEWIEVGSTVVCCK
jgi:hypothetical protein